MNNADCRPPFRFTGKLAKLTVKLGRPQAPPETVEKEERLMERAAQLEKARGR